MDTIGSFDKMELIVLYNPEDSKKDKTESVIKKFVRLSKQQILQLYCQCYISSRLRKRKVQYQQRHCDGEDAIG